MRNPLSIFSSRIGGSALIWTVLAIAAIEFCAARTLPVRFALHEVDRMLHTLDQGGIPAGDALFLGDSVGRQVARAILRHTPGAFVPLASNGGIEMAGQYYILRRYLETHPAPQRVLLMMFNPISGGLDGRFTENYVQRDFLRWREIAELMWTRRSLSFGLVMAAYKLVPTFRYRLKLQRVFPGLRMDRLRSVLFDETTPSENANLDPGHGLLDQMALALDSWFQAPPISEIYFHRMANLLETRGIEWAYLAPPLKESNLDGRPNGFYGRQVSQLSQWQSRYSRFHVHEPFGRYPDDWFVGQLHLKEAHLPVLAADYAGILDDMGFGADPP